MNSKRYTRYGIPEENNNNVKLELSENLAIALLQHFLCFKKAKYKIIEQKQISEINQRL